MGKLASGMAIRLCILSACASGPEANQDWPVYRGSAAANQYSTLRQINRSNVHHLELAWMYSSGDAEPGRPIQCNPIVIGGVLYATTPQLKVVALNAAEGSEIWRFDPSEWLEVTGPNRGVVYWTDGGHDQRIFCTAAHLLYCLDAGTGQLVEGFGSGGFVDLREQLGVPHEQVSISVTSPGIIYDDVLIVGSAVSESYLSAPGHVRAYDVRSGAFRWIFKTIPDSTDAAHETWQLSGQIPPGGTNVWGGLSLDEKRGWVFLATGSPTYDFYGANRLGSNLYGNCIIAVDAKTGVKIWHFQTVHHDLWDYDLPCAPNLAMVQQDGKMWEVVIQPTKMGYLFVLHREDGTPFYDINEVPVVHSDVPGEVSWPSQPIPSTEPFARQGIHDTGDLTNISEEALGYARTRLKEMRHGSMFVPPSLEGTLVMPGTRGGAEWSGAAYDEQTHWWYVNTNEIANIMKLRPVEAHAGARLYQLHCGGCHGAKLQGLPPAIPALAGLPDQMDLPAADQIIRSGRGQMPSFGHLDNDQIDAIGHYIWHGADAQDSEYDEEYYVISGYTQFLDEEGYPATRPPWGSLVAYDITTGQLKWKVPLGEFQALTDRGIAPTGTQTFGGCIVTAGDLVFIGATQDEKFRAFDKWDGRLLWEYKLPFGGYAIPSTYSIDGVQYVVIAAGGGGRNATPSGDLYIAFRLPPKGGY